MIAVILSSSTAAWAQHGVAGYAVQTSRGEIAGRTGPGPSFARTEPVADGESISILEAQGDWSRVRSASGAEFWLHKGYIAEIHRCGFDLDALPARAPDGEFVLERADGKVTSITSSPQNRLVAAGMGDGRISLWSVATGELLQVLSGGGSHPVARVRFNDDGTELLSASRGRVWRWDIETTCRPVRWYAASMARGSRLRYAADGESLLFDTSNSDLQYIDIRTGDIDWEHSWRLDDAGTAGRYRYRYLAASGNALLVQAIGDQHYDVIDLATLDLLGTFTNEVIDYETVVSFDHAPETGRALIVTQGRGGAHRVLVRSGAGEELLKHESEQPVVEAFFLSDGEKIALLDAEGQIIVVDVGSRRVYDPVESEGFHATAIALTGDKSAVIVGSEDGRILILPAESFKAGADENRRQFESYKLPDGLLAWETERRGAWRRVRSGSGESKWVLSSFLSPAQKNPERADREQASDADELSLVPQAVPLVNETDEMLFSADGQLVYVSTLEYTSSGGDRSGPILVFSLKARKLLDIIDLPVTLSGARMSLDGNRLIIYGAAKYVESDGYSTRSRWTTVIVNATTREVEKIAYHGLASGYLTGANGPQFLVRTSDSRIHIHDALTGLVTVLETGPVTDAAFMPDGRSLVWVAENYVHLWNIAQEKSVYSSERELGEYSYVWPIGEERHVLIRRGPRDYFGYDLSKEEILFELETPEPINQIFYFADQGQLVFLTSKGNAELRDPRSGALLAKHKVAEVVLLETAISPDGSTLIQVADYIGNYRVTSLDGVESFMLEGVTKMPANIAFSTDGRFLLVDYLAVNMAKTRISSEAAYWDLQRGHLIKADDFEADVEFGPEGMFFPPAKGSSESRVVDNAFWSVIGSVRAREYENRLDLAEITPDGMATLRGHHSALDEVFDLPQDGSRLFQSHFLPLNGLAVASRGEGVRLASSSRDGTVRLWEPTTGRELAQFIAFNDGSWLILTPEGFFHASDGGEKHLVVVDKNDVIPLDRVFDALYRPDLVLEALRGDPDGQLGREAKKLNLSIVLKGGLPPEIETIESSSGSTTDADRTVVGVSLRLRDGGLGRVEVRVNAATQAVNRGEVPAGETTHLDVPVFLTPGKNQIEVVAYNEVNQIASQSRSIEIVSTAEQKEDSALHVVVVGVDKYVDSRLNLNYAVNDAKSVAAGFRKVAAGVYGNVTVHEILNEDATPEGMERAFRSLSRSVQPQDTVIFFLAGHGKTIDGRYYFLHHGYRLGDLDSIRRQGIDQATWQRWFSMLPAAKSVLLYDTCESGSLANANSDFGLESKAAVERLTRATGRTIITATTDTAVALEGYGGHGVFTYTLLEALGAGDQDGDGQLEASELIKYIQTELPEISYRAFRHRQVPQASVWGSSFSLGEPVLVLSPQ